MSNARRFAAAFGGIAVALGAAAASAAVTEASVERIAPDRLLLRWNATGPVDVLQSARPDAMISDAAVISDEDADGRHEATASGVERLYFLLRASDGATLRVAERAVPLDHGSNFRDIGGYPGADGKHVRWGLIFRSGATPLLSERDLERVKALGLREMVDLRSSEEQKLAPTRIQGVEFTTVSYSMAQMSAGRSAVRPTSLSGDIYKYFPGALVEQTRIVFDSLLEKDAPIVYNCSAGQDRTGFVTAMILSALGVPRDVILTDYHLSTEYRRPLYEMPPLDAAAHPDSPIVQYFAKVQKDPEAAKPKPLYTEATPRKSLLEVAFEEIERQWGSVDAYLQREVKITPAELETLRATYLE